MSNATFLNNKKTNFTLTPDIIFFSLAVSVMYGNDRTGGLIISYSEWRTSWAIFCKWDNEWRKICKDTIKVRIQKKAVFKIVENKIKIIVIIITIIIIMMVIIIILIVIIIEVIVNVAVSILIVINKPKIKECIQ